ncbi:phenylpropionate dioxygenase [Rhizorhabdus wittichii]|uniref:Phenylpropionate dioxygenase n=1 Tax=Rhizorhabdus wittichii TaxID=160791 RepID=A0A975HFD1_9SPHN|nr:aromatic-ring-hydroxylating dioxygenase subunit beta [Rhizorhabdus wittichii]QTH23431.1 phenylpropionate dioxygenase [Rhizorhabdus wittichii]
MTDPKASHPYLEESAVLAAVSRFLSYEAKLLDERRFTEWLDLLDEAMIYEVPLRVARTNYGDETSAGGHHVFDNKSRLRARVARLMSGHCWAESPPSRTVRVVGSILVEKADEDDLVHVESALILYRQRNDPNPGEILSARRQDSFKLTGDGPILTKRRALIADSVIRSPNLDVFL